MSKIYSLISDQDVEVSFLNDLKNRRLDYKHIFTGDKTIEIYSRNYSFLRPYYKNSEFGERDFLKFFRENILQKIHKQQGLSIISLGCGEANFGKEKETLKVLSQEDKIPLTYVGIDFSKYMLEFVEDRFSDCDFEKHFVYADFRSYDFRSEIGYLIDKYPNKVFSLLGLTIINFVPTNIVDTLSNMLKKGNYLWLTLTLREGVAKKDDFKIFSYYGEYLKADASTAFKFEPLRIAGVPFKNGKMTLSASEEKSVGALKFTFNFEFSKKTTTKFRKERLTFLPEEKIELIDIRVFDSDVFIEFLKQHGFECLARERKGNYGQFLFRKK